MAGPGYHTIEFEKEIKYLTENNCYILKPTKSFLHKKGKVNILEENIPHLIFNVPETTISIALWTEKKEEKSPIDPGEAEALKLYNEAVSKGINPADIGTQAGDIVSGSDKKSQKAAEPEPEVVKE